MNGIEAPQERPFVMCCFVSLLPYVRASGTLSVDFLFILPYVRASGTLWVRYLSAEYLLFAFFMSSSVGAILMVENDA